MTHVHPDPRNRPLPTKTLFSVLAIFRNEAHVLDEWLRHYFRFGAEHVYLINNNSVDDFRAVLTPYIEAGCVSLFECTQDGYQIGAYTELLPILQKECEWIGVFDLDEFIYPTDGESIITVLQRYSEYESVLIPWLSFGSSGHLVQPPSVVHGFVQRGPADVSRAFLKAISRPMDIVYFHQHNPTMRSNKKILSNGAPVNNDPFILLLEENVKEFSLINNHYRLQSRDYFVRVKTMRPEVHEDVKHIQKNVSFFDEHDSRWNSVCDTGLRDKTAFHSA